MSCDLFLSYVQLDIHWNAWVWHLLAFFCSTAVWERQAEDWKAATGPDEAEDMGELLSSVWQAVCWGQTAAWAATGVCQVYLSGRMPFLYPPVYQSAALPLLWTWAPALSIMHWHWHLHLWAWHLHQICQHSESCSFRSPIYWTSTHREQRDHVHLSRPNR